MNATFATASLVLALFATPVLAQERSTPRVESTSCMAEAPPPRAVGAARVGIESCEILAESAAVFDVAGRPFRYLQIRLGGTVDGWAIIEPGGRGNYFTDGPGIVFPQSGNKETPVHGIGRYAPPKNAAQVAPRGHAIELFLPADRARWNGKLFITAHGAGSYAPVGELVPRDPLPHQAAKNFYVGLMLDKGYAVAHTMRSAARDGGDISVTLDDGRIEPHDNVSSNTSLVLPWIELVKRLVAKDLGARPTRTYFFGHSAGAMLGHLLNYLPGANRDAEGKLVIDGFLMDDPGGGLWLPKLLENGKDILFATDADKRYFAKQIDVAHQLYLGETGDFLVNKRENARLLATKGLGDHYRLYEVRGVSHFDANHPSLNELAPGVDMSGLYVELIDRLDDWVERGVAPPGNRSDETALSAGAPAISLPITACPLGEYHAFPSFMGVNRRATQLTEFAAYDGVNLEPLDGRGQLVDMNGDGKRDRRETVTEAWRRLGLLTQSESFDRDRYVACVTAAGAKLVADKLLPQAFADFYRQEAASRSLAEVR